MSYRLSGTVQHGAHRQGHNRRQRVAHSLGLPWRPSIWLRASSQTGALNPQGGLLPQSRPPHSENSGPYYSTPSAVLVYNSATLGKRRFQLTVRAPLAYHVWLEACMDSAVWQYRWKVNTGSTTGDFLDVPETPSRRLEASANSLSLPSPLTPRLSQYLDMPPPASPRAIHRPSGDFPLSQVLGPRPKADWKEFQAAKLWAGHARGLPTCHGGAPGPTGRWRRDSWRRLAQVPARDGALPWVFWGPQSQGLQQSGSTLVFQHSPHPFLQLKDPGKAGPYHERPRFARVTIPGSSRETPLMSRNSQQRGLFRSTAN